MAQQWVGLLIHAFIRDPDRTEGVINDSKWGSRCFNLLTNANSSLENSGVEETISQRQELRWCFSPPKMLKKHTFNCSLNEINFTSLVL